MKHVPTPQQSLVAALAVLDELQVQWRNERENEQSAALEEQVRARAEELARRERIRARAIASAGRKRDAAARRRLVQLREEQRELEAIEARARATAAARLQDARREIDARLRAHAISRVGRVAVLGSLGVAGLVLAGAAIFAPFDVVPSGSPRTAAVDPTAVGAMRERLDAFAERQAMLADAHDDLLELRASIPPVAEEEGSPAEVPAKPTKSPRKQPVSSKPKPSARPSSPPKTRPPIVLETDGDPLAGIG